MKEQYVMCDMDVERKCFAFLNFMQNIGCYDIIDRMNYSGSTNWDLQMSKGLQI